MIQPQESSPGTIPEPRALSHPLTVFVVALAAGAALFGARWAVRGNADPFVVDWPLYLQLGSLALTSLMSIISRRPFVTAVGVYCGLVAYMLIDGHAEYPVASLIALTVHGLVPALAGALLVFGMLFRQRRPAGRRTE